MKSPCAYQNYFKSLKTSFNFKNSVAFTQCPEPVCAQRTMNWRMWLIICTRINFLDIISHQRVITLLHIENTWNLLLFHEYLFSPYLNNIITHSTMSNWRTNAVHHVHLGRAFHSPSINMLAPKKATATSYRYWLW